MHRMEHAISAPEIRTGCGLLRNVIQEIDNNDLYHNIYKIKSLVHRVGLYRIRNRSLGIPASSPTAKYPEKSAKKLMYW